MNEAQKQSLKPRPSVENLMRSGVYLIWNPKKNMFYVGQSLHLLQRLGLHTRRRQKGNPFCKPLQADWNQHPNGFKFLVRSKPLQHDALNHEQCVLLSIYQGLC